MGFCSTSAETPVKYYGGRMSPTSCIAVSIDREILRDDILLGSGEWRFKCAVYLKSSKGVKEPTQIRNEKYHLVLFLNGRESWIHMPEEEMQKSLLI